MTIVSSLWIGRSLSPLARACIGSFLVRGHAFRLYCYRPPDNVPAGCELADAADILPESQVIHYSRGPGKGSVSLFSNMFRYRLLHEAGGWWVDTDMFCLTSTLPDTGVVLAQEDQQGLNCAIMRFPQGHAALLEGYEECVRRGDDVEWGDTGPRLLTQLAQKHGLADSVFSSGVFYPIHYRQFWIVFDPRRAAAAGEAIRNAAGVHLWNNMISRSNLDLSVLPPRGSLLASMYEQTIGFGSFASEYVLADGCAADGLDLRIVPRM